MGSEEVDPADEHPSALNYKKDHARSFYERHTGFLGMLDQEVKKGIVGHILKKIVPLKIKPGEGSPKRSPILYS